MDLQLSYRKLLGRIIWKEYCLCEAFHTKLKSGISFKFLRTMATSMKRLSSSNSSKVTEQEMVSLFSKTNNKLILQKKSLISTKLVVDMQNSLIKTINSCKKSANSKQKIIKILEDMSKNKYLKWFYYLFHQILSSIFDSIKIF